MDEGGGCGYVEEEHHGQVEEKVQRPWNKSQIGNSKFTASF